MKKLILLVLSCMVLSGMAKADDDKLVRSRNRNSREGGGVGRESEAGGSGIPRDTVVEGRAKVRIDNRVEEVTRSGEVRRDARKKAQEKCAGQIDILESSSSTVELREGGFLIEHIVKAYCLVD